MPRKYLVREIYCPDRGPVNAGKFGFLRFSQKVVLRHGMIYKFFGSPGHSAHPEKNRISRKILVLEIWRPDTFSDQNFTIFQCFYNAHI